MTQGHILNSWKEISSYLGRGIRTVQRWEAFFGMPVHRPAGKERSAVVAFTSELDTWLQSSRTSIAVRQASLVTQVIRSKKLEQVRSQTSRLLRQTDKLLFQQNLIQKELQRSLALKSQLEAFQRNQGNEKAAVSLKKAV